MKIIIEVFSMLKKDFPNLKLVKIGNSTDELNNIINKLKIKNDIIFTNHLDEEEISKYYSHAKLLLFPSLEEGFGLPIIEAMACGCPVVTSNRNPMKEITADTQVLCNPESINDMYLKCKKVLNSKEIQEKMSKRGIKRANYFSWKKTTLNIKNVMQ